MKKISTVMAKKVEKNGFRTRDEARRTEPQELSIRRQPTRRANGGDSGQLNQHVSPARVGSPAVSHAVVDESTPGKNERFPTLSLRILPRVPGRLSRRYVECTCLFLPPRHRPSPVRYRGRLNPR